MKLCVIPARGGSKRIPSKNIKSFHGQPIIAYSIKAALACELFDHVAVSTDSQTIAKISKEYGAESPFMRPSELSDDHTGTIPVIKHAIEWFEKHQSQPKTVCCLYPTAPFVTSEDLIRSHQQFVDAEVDYCISVTEFDYPIQRSLKLTDEQNIKMFYPEHYHMRSQDLESAYHDAGQFYWGTANAYKAERPFFTSKAIAYELPRTRVQDIDTPGDWQLAEHLFDYIK